jgi:hypothetical protein
MRDFWELELNKINGADLQQWFSDPNDYWHEHKLILR